MSGLWGEAGAGGKARPRKGGLSGGGYTMASLDSSDFSSPHHPRDFGVTATMRHGSGKLASNTGDADSTSSAGGFLANSATDIACPPCGGGGAGESPHTRNAAKDGAGTRVSVSARAAQPPRRGSERLATRGAWRVGFRGVGRRTSGARSDPKTGLGGRSAPTRPRSPDPKTKNPLWMRKTPLTLLPTRRRMIS